MARDDDGIKIGEVFKALAAIGTLMAAWKTYKTAKQQDEELMKRYQIKPQSFKIPPDQHKKQVLDQEPPVFSAILTVFGAAHPFSGAFTVALTYSFVSYFVIDFILRLLFFLQPIAIPIAGAWMISIIVCFVYVWNKVNSYKQKIAENTVPAQFDTGADVDIKAFVKEHAIDALDSNSLMYSDDDPHKHENGLYVGRKTFTLDRERRKHMYVVGMTGVGKSSAVLTWFIQDVLSDRGCAVIDPHGKLADDAIAKLASHLYLEDREVNKRTDLTLDEIEERIKEHPLLKRIQIIDPSDPDFAVGFNPLEKIEGVDSYHQAQQIETTFKKIWKYDENQAPVMGQLLRNTAYVLIENEMTLVESTLFLTNKQFRERMLGRVNHPGVLRFFRERFDKWEAERRTTNIDSTYNKLEPFVDDPHLSPIIGQKKSTIKLRSCMDNKDILIVKLPKGKMESNANLFGGFLITSLHLAAQSREGMREEEINPFYVYADEFQNFMSANFDTILSEDRKYGLHFSLINQYLGAIPEEVRDAVFGNINLMVVFRLGNKEDAELIGSHLYLPTGKMIKEIQEEPRLIHGTPFAYNKKNVTTWHLNEEIALKSTKLLDLPDRTFVFHERGKDPVLDYTMNYKQVDINEKPFGSYIKKMRVIINKRHARQKDVVREEIKKRTEEYVYKKPDYKLGH